jgi:hypothetical protein
LQRAFPFHLAEQLNGICVHGDPSCKLTHRNHLFLKKQYGFS